MAFKDRLMDIVAIGGAILMKRDVLWFIGSKFSCIQTLIPYSRYEIA